MFNVVCVDLYNPSSEEAIREQESVDCRVYGRVYCRVCVSAISMREVGTSPSLPVGTSTSAEHWVPTQCSYYFLGPWWWGPWWWGLWWWGLLWWGLWWWGPWGWGLLWCGPYSRWWGLSVIPFSHASDNIQQFKEMESMCGI